VRGIAARAPRSPGLSGLGPGGPAVIERKDRPGAHQHDRLAEGRVERHVRAPAERGLAAARHARWVLGVGGEPQSVPQARGQLDRAPARTLGGDRGDEQRVAEEEGIIDGGKPRVRRAPRRLVAWCGPRQRSDQGMAGLAASAASV